MVQNFSVKKAVVRGVLIFVGLEVLITVWVLIAHPLYNPGFRFLLSSSYCASGTGGPCWGLQATGDILILLAVSLFLGVLSIVLWPKLGKER